MQEQYRNKMIEVEDLISRVSDDRYRMVLLDRYISMMRWDDIARLHYYDVRWIYMLHEAALQEVDKLLT